MKRPEAPVLKPKRGFNLVEAAIVLGVIGLVIGGIWAAASQMRLSMKVDKNIDAIMRIGTALQKVLRNADVAPAAAGNWIHRLAYALVGDIDGWKYDTTYGWVTTGEVATTELQQLFALNYSVSVSSGVFNVNIDEVTKPVCLRMASRFKSMMLADPAGNLISAVTWGSNVGGWQGVYIGPTKYVSGVFRFDTAICTTDRSSIGVAFTVQQP